MKMCINFLKNCLMFANYSMQKVTFITATVIEVMVAVIYVNLVKYFYDNGAEKYLLTYRNNEEKLLKVVDNYWVFICKIKKSDNTALDFFNKEYTWNFRDYRQGIDISMSLEEVIKSNNELIELNGLDQYFIFFL